MSGLTGNLEDATAAAAAQWIAGATNDDMNSQTSSCERAAAGLFQASRMKSVSAPHHQSPPAATNQLTSRAYRESGIMSGTFYTPPTPSVVVHRTELSIEPKRSRSNE